MRLCCNGLVGFVPQDAKRLRDVSRGGRVGSTTLRVNVQLVRSLVAVGFVAAVMAGVVVGAAIASQPSPCCFGKRPYVSLYDRPLSRVNAVLAEGDGQAFAAIARDPLLRRPGVMAEGEFSYRAQRPVWAYLDWVAALGQPNLTAWALAALTVLSCAGASVVIGLLLVERGTSPWWSLGLPVVALEALREFTPELLALALFGAGLCLWQRDRRAWSIVALSLAVLTRETLLVGVVTLGAWECLHTRRWGRGALRRAAPLLVPTGTYVVWILVLEIRVGTLPFDRSQGRVGLPGVGFITSLERGAAPVELLTWAAAAVVLCAAALTVAHGDILAWITAAYVVFASMLGESVWSTNSGYTRTLLPLYALGGVAVVGGMRTRRANRPSAKRPHSQPSPEPDDTAVGGLASARS